MEYVLIIAGIVLTSLGFLMESPLIKEKLVDPRAARQWLNEEERIKQLKGEITEIKQEVVVLLAELERTSENVVSDLEAQVTQVKSYLNQMDARQVRLPEQPDQLEPSQPAPREKPTTQSNSVQKLTRGKSSSTGVVQQKNQTVYALADQGLDLAEIARQAKIGKGEVQLILELRGRGE